MRVYLRSDWRGRFGLLMILSSLLLFVAGCNTAWTTEASTIIGLLVPAIQAALGILTAFGVGLSPDVMTAVNKWATEASNDLLNVVKPLLDKYAAAEDAAKPGLLAEIEAALQTTADNLKQLLPAIHVNNPDTQAKIVAVFNAILLETEALINLVPAITGKVTSHKELKKLVADLKDPDHFRADFNQLAGEFGDQYKV